MEDLNIKQLTLAVRTIAEEKNLPEETVLSVIEQAIAAAWRRDNGTRDQLVRASLNINNGTAVVSVVKTVVEEVENDANQIDLEEAKEIDTNKFSDHNKQPPALGVNDCWVEQSADFVWVINVGLN